MPRITINEIDSTTPLMSIEDVYTVFVPGNVEKYKEENKHLFGNYTLFTSVSDFNTLVGNPTYDAINPYKIIDSEKYADPGHRIAKLLLEHNLPVLYYVPSAKEVQQSHYEVADPQPTSETFAADTYYKQEGSEFVLADAYVEGTTYYKQISDPSTYRPCLYAEVRAELNDLTNDIFDILKDKSLYDIRYVSNGGYDLITKSGETITIPESVRRVKAVAESRQDCIALVDFAKELKAKDLISLETEGKLAELNSTYVQLAVPHCIYDNVVLPANIAIIEAFGNQIKSAPNWFATAGFARGIISGEPIEVIGENVANSLIHDDIISINPITKVSTSATNTAILIWGNRTAYYTNKGLKASSFLNIRQLCCDLKKRLYRSAKQSMFEQNTDRLWFNFKSGIEEFLNNALTNEGIYGYKIYKLNPTERAQVKALVKIVPIEAVEKFDLTIELADSVVTVTES